MAAVRGQISVWPGSYILGFLTLRTAATLTCEIAWVAAPELGIGAMQ